ncbi:unnamed protein product [Durusdinium trenchii]|uniref:Uncharacterized protein n=1 Tax=Durusdinium trenchii TaxID=1381693 RepID=A0ABP0NY70_9DINO
MGTSLATQLICGSSCAVGLYKLNEAIQRNTCADTINNRGNSRYKEAVAFNDSGFSKDCPGKYEEAIEDYNRAIELDPNYAVAFCNRGIAKGKLGRYEEAIEDCNRAIELAIEDFNRAIELDPNYAMSFCMRGSSVRLLGNHEAAIRDLDKALELEPENALFFRSRGDCKQAIGKHEAAIEDYNLAIELNRDDVIAVANRSFSECAQRKLDKPPIDVELVWLVEKLKQLQKEVNQPIDCLLKQVMEQTLDFDEVPGAVNSNPNMQLLPPSQLDPTSDSGSSVCSSGSWIDVGSQGSCCFLPDTYFTVLMEDGEVLTPARRLFQGANVVAANGRTTEVTFPPEQHQVHAVIELQAGDAFLVVSPDHRILVPGNVTVQAQDLHVGSEVILDGNLAALTSLKWKVEPTIVLKIGFKPDLPVAAFLRPPAILSKGFRQKPFRRGIRKKASTFAQGDDALTILTMPDTEGYLTD